MARVRETVKRVSGSVSRLFNRKKTKIHISIRTHHIKLRNFFQNGMPSMFNDQNPIFFQQSSLENDLSYLIVKFYIIRRIRKNNIKLADFDGSIEAVVFPKNFVAYKDILKSETVIALKGRVSSRNGELSLVADKLKAL